MPTVAVDACEVAGLETPDRHMSLTIWGTNRHGLRSHIHRPADGAQASALQGVYYTHPGFSGGSEIGFHALETEGPYIKQAAMYWKDLGIPRGAQIVSATLTYADGAALEIVNQASIHEPTPHEGRIWGMLEPNALIRCIDGATGSGYDAVSQVEHWAQYGYRRKWRINSYPQHQRHTATVLTFSLAGTIALPDLAPIIQELVNQPKWKPDNRICLYGAPGVVKGVFVPDYRYGWSITLKGDGAGGLHHLRLTVTYT
jgi:hypothetical protein